MFVSAVLMAVKKGPYARGGIVWKTHAFNKMSQTRQRNAAKNLKLVQEVHETLKRAARTASDAASKTLPAGASTSSKPL